MRVTAPSQTIRFGVFEVDLHTRELRKQGLKLKLTGQPFDVLAMLLERPGELVAREEIQKKLWPADTFVDFEHGLNTAVKKLREALGDSADNPRFVETLARRGYRFIAPVNTVSADPSPVTDVGAGLVPARGRPRGAPLQKRWTVAVIGGVLVISTLVFALNVGGLRDRILRAVGAQHAAPRPKIESIAVLPLENLSRDPDQEYFADGMTEELITELGQVGSLRVISRTSMMRYKQTKKPLPEIARELNVQAIVEGSVLRSEDWVRVTVNLIDAKTDRHLWAHSYESELRDVLALQSRLAHDITQQVQAKLTPQEQTRLASSRPVNPEAHEAYLMGLYHRSEGASQEAYLKKSIEYFTKATTIDPKYGLAYAGLARAYIHQAYTGYLVPAEAVAKARAAATRALEFDENLAEAHAALGQVKYTFDWDWAGAERELKRAIELNPNSQSAHECYAQYLTIVGRFEEAIEERKRAFDLEPTNRFWFGWTYFYARRYDDAVLEFKKDVDAGVGPLLFFSQWWLASVYTKKGMGLEAVGECEKLKKLQTGPLTAEACAFAYLAAGRRNEAQNAFKELQKTQYIDPYATAHYRVQMGDKKGAREALINAYEQRSSSICVLKVDPRFDLLRSDPRFKDLLRRMNFPP